MAARRWPRDVMSSSSKPAWADPNHGDINSIANIRNVGEEMHPYLPFNVFTFFLGMILFLGVKCRKAKAS